MQELPEDDPLGWFAAPDRQLDPLAERSLRAAAEIRRTAEALGPQAEEWQRALRDVHAHIYGVQPSEGEEVPGVHLVDAYRRLYDELLRLSAILDPDLVAGAEEARP